MRDALQVAGAVAAFAGLHTLLASRRDKEAFAQVTSVRTRDALYRPLFVAQAVVTTAALAEYVWRHSGRTLYHVRGTPAVLMRAGQAACVVAMVDTARRIGVGRQTGVPGLLAYAKGSNDVPPPQEAQGPPPGPSDAMKGEGAFAWSRHPLNLLPTIAAWLNPQMTVGLLAATAAATAYFYLGSFHEESLMKRAHGQTYERYMRSGVAFFLPVAQIAQWLGLRTGFERNKWPEMNTNEHKCRRVGEF